MTIQTISKERKWISVTLIELLFVLLPIFIFTIVYSLVDNKVHNKQFKFGL